MIRQLSSQRLSKLSVQPYLESHYEALHLCRVRIVLFSDVRVEFDEELGAVRNGLHAHQPLCRELRKISKANPIEPGKQQSISC